MNDKDKSFFIKLILVSIIFISLITVFGLTAELVKNKKVINPQVQVSVTPSATVLSEGGIKTGKVGIDYKEIDQTQKIVDSGSQPWRLNPIMFLESEMTQYGFDEKDYETLANMPSVDDQKKLGVEITSVKMEMTHKDKIYTITLVQPFAGPGKIWTISEVNLKEKNNSMTVKLYYYNKNLDPKFDCLADAVMPIEREITITENPIKDTIELLIKGEITEQEKLAGFSSEFPHAGFNLLSANLKDGVLILKFPELPSFTTGGSCRIGLLYQEVVKTAKQFSEVKQVIFDPVEIFQP